MQTVIFEDLLFFLFSINTMAWISLGVLALTLIIIAIIIWRSGR